MKSVYCCANCRNIRIYEKTTASRCSLCGNQMLSLNMSPNQWNSLSTDQMRQEINKARGIFPKNQPFKPTYKQNNASYHPNKAHSINKGIFALFIAFLGVIGAILYCIF